MIHLNPHHVAHQLTRTVRRLACPVCGESAIATEQPPQRADTRLVRVECAYDDHYQQYVEIPNQGEPRTVEPQPLTREILSHRATLDADKDRRRGQCIVPGCRRVQQEGGFCWQHHAHWRIAGRPEDRHAWAARWAEGQKAAAAAESPRAASSGATRPEGGPELEAARRNPTAIGGRRGNNGNHRKPGPTKACEVAGCDRPSKARGLCRRCYARWMYQGKPDVVAFKAMGLPCEVVGEHKQVKGGV